MKLLTAYTLTLYTVTQIIDLTRLDWSLIKEVIDRTKFRFIASARRTEMATATGRTLLRFLLWVN